MDKNRKIAIVTGILFIIGTVAGIICASIIKPILTDANYLVNISANENRLILGAFFQFVMGVACAGIAISLYPILKKYSQSLAIGAVGFRIIEGLLAILCSVGIILLLTLSKEFVKLGASDLSYFQTLGKLIISGRDWIGNVAMLISWCIGALMYYYVFYIAKLVPKWLSIWGIVGVILCIMASLLVMFNIIELFGNIQVILNAPIALQEMILALWLIFKGFNPMTSSFGSKEKV